MNYTHIANMPVMGQINSILSNNGRKVRRSVSYTDSTFHLWASSIFISTCSSPNAHDSFFRLSALYLHQFLALTLQRIMVTILFMHTHTQRDRTNQFTVVSITLDIILPPFFHLSLEVDSYLIPFFSPYLSFSQVILKLQHASESPVQTY